MKIAMKLGAAFGVALLAAPLGLAAQNASSGVAGRKGSLSGQTATLLPFASPNLCPVSVRAQHLRDGKMVKTERAPHPGNGMLDRPGSQRFGLHLTLTSPDERTISSAILDESGPTGAGIWMKAGAYDALANANEGADSNKVPWATRTIQVQFASDSGRIASADVYAEGLTAVLSIDLRSVTFTDGSTWTPAAGHACRVAPDPLMLIAAGK